MVPDLHHMAYEERLKAFELPSLYYRRKRGDMVNTYQMFHGGVDIEPTNFAQLTTKSTTRGHCDKLRKPAAVCRVRRSAFAVRIVDDWNSLPANVCSPTVNSFKAQLE